MTTQTTKPPEEKTKTRKPTSPRITPQESKVIRAMRASGMTYREIGKETKHDHKVIWQHLQKIDQNNLTFQEVKANLADQFLKIALDNANLSSRLTAYLLKKTDEELDQLSIHNIAAVKRSADIGMGIAHDHYRVEAGLSTQNILSIHADVAAIKGYEINIKARPDRAREVVAELIHANTSQEK
jgi:hypothetical protein